MVGVMGKSELTDFALTSERVYIMRLFKKIGDFASAKSASIPALGAATAMLSKVCAAPDPVTGLDVPALVAAGIVAVGVVVGAALAGYFGFKAVKIGLRWFNKVGG